MPHVLHHALILAEIPQHGQPTPFDRIHDKTVSELVACGSTGGANKVLIKTFLDEEFKCFRREVIGNTEPEGGGGGAPQPMPRNGTHHHPCPNGGGPATPGGCSTPISFLTAQSTRDEMLLFNHVLFKSDDCWSESELQFTDDETQQP